MDFDFFNELKQLGTIKVGRHLAKKLVQLKSLERMDVVQSTFPVGHPDEGCKIDRYILGKSKYLLAEEVSNILSSECHKFFEESDSNSEIQSNSKTNNPQVLVKLLTLLLDPNTTHFTLG